MSAPVQPQNRRSAARIRELEFFDPQPAHRDELPDPFVTVERLALIACEILAGTRAIEQIGRWVSEDVYRMIAERAVSARRARERGPAARVRPAISVTSTRISEPRDGVIEGVSLVHIGPRTRAVCIRLEGFDRRWRASALALI